MTLSSKGLDSEAALLQGRNVEADEVPGSHRDTQDRQYVFAKRLGCQ